jgi:Asp-tRNA(Asn)/Glu-tRNA(Gln) amidotransferase A subunit family amidase
MGLAYLTARDGLARCAARELSPVEWVAALLERAERLGASVNATTRIYRDAALAQARESEARYAAGTARLLEGVPVAIKEETSVAGWQRTIGSYLHDEMPVVHHPIVDKLLAAGAVLHIQTTVPEFCVIGQTLSERYGVTRNPWNLAMTPGGSSGGSGAALAAGLAPLATGSDMGGSIRIPAALGGLYGYKPPFGRLAATPGEELLSFAVEGPMARTWDDLVLMQNVIQGPHPLSYSTVPCQPLADAPPDLDGMRVACAAPTTGLCPDTRRNLLAACAALESRGARIERLDLDWNLGEIGDVLIEAIFGLFFDEYLERFDDRALSRATPYLRWLIGRFRGKRNSIMRAAALATRLHRELDDKLWSRGVRALVCPTVLTTAVPADLDLTCCRALDIEGGSVDSYLGWVWTTPFNLLSRYPAMAVPTGLAASGVPTSMQIVAPPFDDETVFTVSYHHSRAQTAGLYATRFPVMPEAA